jgi:hypothetical protein
MIGRSCTPHSKQADCLVIEIEYRVKATHDQRSLVYPFIRSQAKHNICSRGDYAPTGSNLDDRHFQILLTAKRIPHYSKVDRS